MRVRSRTVLGLLLVVTLAGCGAMDETGGVATAGGTASPTSGVAGDGLSEQERALKFGQCMRENGVPDFPDPTFDESGGMSIDAPKGADPQQVDAAMQVCKRYLPNGGEPTKVDPQRLEQLRKLAQCMRDHGVKNFPDPTENGIQADGNLPGMDPNDPTFQAAMKECDRYAPAPSGEPGSLKQKRTDG